VRHVPLSYLKPAALALAATHLSVAIGMLGMLPYLEQGAALTGVTAGCFPLTIFGALVTAIVGAGPSPDARADHTEADKRHLRWVRSIAGCAVVIGIGLLLYVGIAISVFLRDFAQPVGAAG
jgi:hypothetical protein